MARIRWKKDITLTVMENEVDSFQEEIEQDSFDDVDIFNTYANTNSVDMRFGSGDICYGVSIDAFEVLTP